MPEIDTLLKKASISMLLDSYNAIFSDFDPRPYSKRAFSDDFLIEANKALRETSIGVFELHFLIPKHLRDPKEEILIKERLHQHFRETEHLLKQETQKVIKKGIVVSALGFLVMLVLTLFNIFVPQSIWENVLGVFLEPSGWFMVWYGLDHIFYISKEKQREQEFHTKMTKAEFHFDTY